MAARRTLEDLRQFLGLVGMVAAAFAALLALYASWVFDRWAVANHFWVIRESSRRALTLPGMAWWLVATAFAAAAVHLWRRFVRDQPPPKAPPLDFSGANLPEMSVWSEAPDRHQDPDPTAV